MDEMEKNDKKEKTDKQHKSGLHGTGRQREAEADYLAGMKTREIADKYGVSINTVKSWKYRYCWMSKGKSCPGSDKDRTGASGSEKRGEGLTCGHKADASLIGENYLRLPPDEEAELSGGLTCKQKLFAELYIQNFNARQAAIKAGYAVDSAKAAGHLNLLNPHVRAYIEALKELKRTKLLMSEEDIVERYMHIAFADITDFVEFGRATVPVWVKNEETGKTEAVNKEVNDVRFKESSMVDGGIVSEVKVGRNGASIKLEDRMKALQWLSNYFNMNPMNRHKMAYENGLLELNRKKAADAGEDETETGVVMIADVADEE